MVRLKPTKLITTMTTLSLLLQLSIVIVTHPSQIYTTSQKLEVNNKVFSYLGEIGRPSSSSLSYHELIFDAPKEDYDPWTFDPHSIHGTPYGGYGRATKSRLAALPLRLITELSSDTPLEYDLVKQEDKKDDEDEDNDDDNQEQENEETFFTMVDGEGQKFACKLYYEYELEFDSLDDSMFDIALERNAFSEEQGNDEEEEEEEDVMEEDVVIDPAFVDDDEYENESEEESEDGLVAEDSYMESEEDPIAEHSNMESEDIATDNTNDNDSNLIQKEAERIEEEQPQPPPKDTPQEAAQQENEIKNVTPKTSPADSKLLLQTKITNALSQLQGYCAQYHKDWWSYEWCHEQGIVQFHISMKDRKDPAMAGAQTGMATFRVENMTPLGIFVKRVIDIPDMDEDKETNGNGETKEDVVIDNDEDDVDDDYYDDTTEDNNVQSKSEDTKPPLTDTSKSPEEKVIQIIDQFKEGQYCAEVGQERHVKVQFTCCQSSSTQSIKYQEHQHGKKGGIFGQKQPMSVIRESSDVHVIFQGIEEKEVCEYTATICTNLICDPLEEFYRMNGTKDPFQQDVDTVMNAILPPTAIVQETTHDNNKEPAQPIPIPIHRDDSIRDILDKALSPNCLSMNAGWWTYGFCHTSQIHQFHEDVTLDPLTAMSNAEIGSRYVLGKYQKSISENFPKEEEIRHMGSSQDSDGSSTSDPHYIQEYTHGDVCDDTEVMDSAIKGGNYGDGKVERSTTVRFFCGSQKTILRVEEDSTCHYVMDISVPELCHQKYFEVPHLKTQVVKCLPVDDY